MTADDVIDRELDRLRSRLETGDARLWSRIRASRLTFIVLFCSVTFFQLRDLPGKLSRSILDAALIVQPKVDPGDVRLVTITDQDYETLFNATSPLDPQALGSLLTALSKGGPAVIVVDLDTSHAKFTALEGPRNARIVWAVDGEEAGGGIVPRKAVGGMSMPPAWSAAVAAVPNDAQGIVRSYRREFPTRDGAAVPSLAFAAAQALLAKPIPSAAVTGADNDRLLDFRYRFFTGSASDTNPLSASSVLRAAAGAGWPKGLLHNKVAILGGTYKAGRDRYATPVGLMEGCEIVAQATEAEIRHTDISRANPWIAGCVQLVAGFLLIVVYNQFSLRLALLSSLILIPALSLVASLILFHRVAAWAAIFPVLVAVLISELYSKAAFFLDICNSLRKAKEKNRDAGAGSPPEGKQATGP